jgi:N-acetylmuramoyl-L-alanine amidase
MRPLMVRLLTRWPWFPALLIAALLIFGLLIASVLVSVKNTIRPEGIIIHHSTLPPTPDTVGFDLSWLNEVHKQRGWGAFYWGKVYHVGYHYVILPDGTVQVGRPEHMLGSHSQGHNHYLGICLIGDFSSRENPTGERGPIAPTQAQMRSLEALCRQLQARYGFPIERVHLHREVNDYTECPGDRFPAEEFHGLWAQRP